MVFLLLRRRLHSAVTAVVTEAVAVIVVAATEAAAVMEEEAATPAQVVVAERAKEEPEAIPVLELPVRLLLMTAVLTAEVAAVPHLLQVPALVLHQVLIRVLDQAPDRVPVLLLTQVLEGEAQRPCLQAVEVCLRLMSFSFRGQLNNLWRS